MICGDEKSKRGGMGMDGDGGRKMVYDCGQGEER